MKKGWLTLFLWKSQITLSIVSLQVQRRDASFAESTCPTFVPCVPLTLTWFSLFPLISMLNVSLMTFSKRALWSSVFYTIKLLDMHLVNPLGTQDFQGARKWWESFTSPSAETLPLWPGFCVSLPFLHRCLISDCKVSQFCHYWHFGLDSFCCRELLCALENV